MTAPQTTTSSTPANKLLNWTALLLIVLAVIFNLLRLRNGGHTGYASWALLVGLICSTSSMHVSSRGVRNLLSTVTMLLLIVAIYGMLNGGF